MYKHGHISFAFTLCYMCIQVCVYWPAAFRSISARSLVSSLVLATTDPSPEMSGTAFLRPVRSQLMKSEYDVSTSIICPWPALSLHLPEGGGDVRRLRRCCKKQINHPAVSLQWSAGPVGGHTHCVLCISTSVESTWHIRILARPRRKQKNRKAELFKKQLRMTRDQLRGW